MPVLELHNVRKRFGSVEILTEVTFQLKTGEIMGLFGRNGSGKSTLLKTIFGTLSSDLFDGSIDGQALHPSEVIKKKRIGYLPQHHFLPKLLRVRDIIPIYHQDEESQDLLFYNEGVAKITSKRIGELSLGELKYFECALIASCNHDFILLDEPFSMLDPLQKESLKSLLTKVQPKKGMLITDHYYRDVLDISTKNSVLLNGVLKQINGEKDLIKMNYLPDKNHK